jgi:hypothetical protein
MCDELLASAKAREIDATLSVFQPFQIMPRSKCLLEQEQVALNIGAVACFGRAAIGHALLSLQLDGPSLLPPPHRIERQADEEGQRRKQNYVEPADHRSQPDSTEQNDEDRREAAQRRDYGT